VGAKLAGMTTEPWWSPSEICKVCTERSKPYTTSFLCPRCRRIYEQGGPGLKKKEARFRAMCDQSNGEEKAFLCHFTGLPLTDVPGSRTSGTWEHLSPGDPWSVVLAADLVNKMKVNMTETQFREMVIALADHFRTNEPFDREAFPVDVSPSEITNGSEPDTTPDTP
jgi:hypothetical protein